MPAATAANMAAASGKGKKRPRLPDSQADSAPRSASAQHPSSHQAADEAALEPEPDFEPQAKLARVVSFKDDSAPADNCDEDLPPHLTSPDRAHLHVRGASPLSLSSAELPPGFGSPRSTSQQKAAAGRPASGQGAQGKAVQAEDRPKPAAEVRVSSAGLLRCTSDFMQYLNTRDLQLAQSEVIIGVFFKSGTIFSQPFH